MNIWTLPEVREATLAIVRAEQLVRLEHPELPPRQRLQEARRRCPDEILRATTAITRAELRAHGVWPTVQHERL
jgi:hypothetical protein